MRKLSAGLVAVVLSAAPVAAIADAPQRWGEFETNHARLGVLVMSLTPELRTYFGASTDKGVLVAKVEPNSAAAAAGIKVGDVLVEVKGNPIDEASDVVDALGAAKPGDKVHVALVRDKKSMAIDVTIARKSA